MTFPFRILFASSEIKVKFKRNISHDYNPVNFGSPFVSIGDHELSFDHIIRSFDK